MPPDEAKPPHRSLIATAGSDFIEKNSRSILDVRYSFCRYSEQSDRIRIILQYSAFSGSSAFLHLHEPHANTKRGAVNGTTPCFYSGIRRFPSSFF